MNYAGAFIPGFFVYGNFYRPPETPDGDMKIYGSLHQALWKPLQSLYQSYVM